MTVCTSDLRSVEQDVLAEPQQKSSAKLPYLFRRFLIKFLEHLLCHLVFRFIVLAISHDDQLRSNFRIVQLKGDFIKSCDVT